MARGGGFASATLDLPVKSSQDNQDLLFEALTENIPPVETPVRLVLRVKRRATEPAKTRPDPVSSPKADSDR